MSTIYDCNTSPGRTKGIDAAAHALSAGDLVVIPTDTVYGLAADAFTRPAVTDLLAAKGRGRDVPVPVMVGSWAGLDGLVLVQPQWAKDLVEAFWPGGLTLVVRHAPSLAWDLGDAKGTVAVRMPLHPVALELLDRTGPLAVSSANRHGQPPATTAAAAKEQLGDDVRVYLDGGRSAAAVPSSIVDLTGPEPVLLRAGAVTAEQLREVVPLAD